MHVKCVMVLESQQSNVCYSFVQELRAGIEMCWWGWCTVMYVKII